MKALFEKIIREGEDGQDYAVLAMVARKPIDIEEVIHTRPYTRTRVSVARTEMIDLDKLINSNNLSMVPIEATKGWIRYVDKGEYWPPIYVDSQGFDYPRYVGLDVEDMDDWKMMITE